MMNEPNCKPQGYLDMRETRYNTRNVNKSCLGTVEGINDGVCVYPRQRESPIPRPPPAVCPAQTVALCLVPRPDGMPADPWAQESA